MTYAQPFHFTARPTGLSLSAAELAWIPSMDEFSQLIGVSMPWYQYSKSPLFQLSKLLIFLFQSFKHQTHSHTLLLSKINHASFIRRVRNTEPRKNFPVRNFWRFSAIALPPRGLYAKFTGRSLGDIEQQQQDVTPAWDESSVRRLPSHWKDRLTTSKKK